MIEHRVELDDVAAHRFAVTLTVSHPAALQELALPVWIPGSYMVREFSRHVLSIEARQGRRTCAVQATGKARWTVACSGRAALVVRLLVYAFDTSVRAAFLDSERGFFNGTSLCLQVGGRTQEPQALVIGRLPAGWRVATAMTPAAVDARGIGRYEAVDYDELVDHPFELGPFWSGDFRAGGVLHQVVVSGAWPDVDTSRLLADTKRICEAEIAFWHAASPRPKPPFPRYVFMLNAVDDGYGGLEHRASTALIASRRDLPAKPAANLPTGPSVDAGKPVAKRVAAPADTPDGYVTLLGLIAHEYFHSWNVKRLKPIEFGSLDYGRENLTELLWFFEGFTSYYDDLLLVRSGLIDPARYLRLVAKTVTGVLGTPGRHVQSVADASRDAWIKYYRPDENTPNATVSYYAKGSLVGLLADLRLRELGGSLDGAMRRLWAASGAESSDSVRPGRAGGIDQVMIADALSAEAGRPMADELDAWVHGRADLPLREAFAAHAVSWQESTPTLNQRMGWRVQEGPSGVRVTHVLHGGLAHAAGLAAGDELWAVGRWRLKRVDDLLRLLPEEGSARLLLARDQRVLERTIEVESIGQASASSAARGTTVSLTLVADTQANPAALARRAAWLCAGPAAGASAAPALAPRLRPRRK